MSKEFKIDEPNSIRPYLNEIAERLWAGHAAVMVGAGFSKNADQGFPDWNQLGSLFYLKAHGVKPDCNEKYLNVLRLAEEVEAAIGRPALEGLLRSNIPDLNIEPSELHVQLLELPWVDVFTTNFDTLLERASAKVVTRRYEPVVNKEDIPYAVKPRIVKLHGSFPSQRPFIITEEDYRRYPNDCAPFVNTVQQSLLENTFCLIGFSGDDPNFLQWIGWIRDNLGIDKAQKIYLIGAFDLSSARLQLLAQLGIIVVDFSCCYGIGRHDHKKALKKFFNYLHSKNPNNLDWPFRCQMMTPNQNADHIGQLQEINEEWQAQRGAYPGWLILPYSNRQRLWIFTQGWVNYLPDIEKSPPGLDIKYAFELIWRLERCLLPIFDNIAEFCEILLERYWPFHADKVLINRQLSAGEEEFQSLPWDDIREAWLAIALAMLRFYREEGNIEKWQEAENRLKSLSDHLSAEQREFLNYEGFLFCLFSLDLPSAKQRLESWRPKVSQPYWMAKRAVALAEMGLLDGMDGQIQLSLVETRKRGKNINSFPRYLMVSREAYQMLLLRHVKNVSSLAVKKTATKEEEQLIEENHSKEWRERERKQAFYQQTNSTIKLSENPSSLKEDWSDLLAKRSSERRNEWEHMLRGVRDNQRENELQCQNIRWDELKASRCDPWNELKLFELTLVNPPVQNKDITEKREFDIGKITRTIHFRGEDQDALKGYSFLRFSEEVGLPFCIGRYVLAKQTALLSLRRISKYSFFWATSTLARLGDSKVVDILFDRESVYKLSSSVADQLIQTYLEALKKSRNDIHAGDSLQNYNYGVRLAQILPEVISRLVCKCSIETKHRVLEFIIELYASPDKTKYRNVRNLFQRLVISMSKVEKYNLIPELLNINFPEGLNQIVKDEFLNPFLVLDLNQKPEGPTTPSLEIQPELVDPFFQQAVLDNADQRRWAISSLITLYQLQLLNDDQSKKLAEVIWCKTDQYGLPDGTDFYKFAFLRLPYPEGVVPSQLFKNYVNKTPFPDQKNQRDKGVSITGGDIPLVHEIIGANSNEGSIWTNDDVIEILQRLIKWWGSGKNRLNEMEGVSEKFLPIKEEFRSRFVLMVKLLAEVVGPKLSIDSPDDIKTSLGLLFLEMRERCLPTLEAEAASLHLFPEHKTNVYHRINEALISKQDNIEKDGLSAISKIILSGIGPLSGLEEHDPTSMLSQFITWCPTGSIITALRIVVRFLKDSPTTIPTNVEAATLGRLDRLLSETDYGEDNLDLLFKEKFEVRHTAAILASTLCAHYESNKASVPAVVEKWREECFSPKEFSEIKNVWIDCSRIPSVDN